MEAITEAQEFLARRRLLEEARRLKRDVPAILVAADADPRRLAEAVNPGRVQRLFVAPLNEGQLLAAVDEVLCRRRGSVGRIPFRPLFGRG